MNYRRLSRAHERRTAQVGVSLVELMIAITLGLVAVGAAMSIFLANRKSFALVEGLARVQENARFAVDMLSRDIREAGGVVCGGNLTPVNIVPSGNAWATWDRGLVGDDWNSGFPEPTSGSPLKIANTDSLLLWSASSGGTPIQITQHTINAVNNTGTFTASTTPGYTPDDVVTACDGSQLVTFVVDSVSVGDKTVSYSDGASLTKAIAAGGFLNTLSAELWYVGQSTPGAASSLRRISRSKTTGSTQNDEMVEGVTNMQIQYLLGDATGAPVATSYVDAASVTDWKKVIAVRIILTLATQDSVGTTGSANTTVSRTVPITVGIKRRLL